MESILRIISDRIVKLPLRVTDCQLLRSTESFERSPTSIPTTKLCFWADRKCFKSCKPHRYIFKGKRPGGDVVFGCECGKAFQLLRCAKKHLEESNTVHQTIYGDQRPVCKRRDFSKHPCSGSYSSDQNKPSVTYEKFVMKDKKFHSTLILEAIRTTKVVEEWMYDKLSKHFGKSKEELKDYLIFHDDVFGKDSSVRVHLTAQIFHEADQFWNNHIVN